MKFNNIYGKKGEMDELIKSVLWIIFFIIVIIGLYMLIKILTRT